MSLGPASILGLKPKAAPYKVSDAKGLYLLVQPSGAKYWRFRYRFAGKQNTLSCGVYPGVSLAEARERRDTFRRLLANGENPSTRQKDTKRSNLEAQARQQGAMRFFICCDGALSIRLGSRRVDLTPKETADLRAFLDATCAVPTGG